MRFYLLTQTLEIEPLVLYVFDNVLKNRLKYTFGYCFIESFSSFAYDNVIAFNP